MSRYALLDRWSYLTSNETRHQYQMLSFERIEQAEGHKHCNGTVYLAVL